MPSTDQSELLIRQQDGRILYAVAFNRYALNKRTRRYEWSYGEIDYVHAHNQREARIKVKRSNPGRLDIIDIAPVIGGFLEDEKKGIVSLT